MLDFFKCEWIGKNDLHVGLWILKLIQTCLIRFIDRSKMGNYLTGYILLVSKSGYPTYCILSVHGAL